MNNIINKNKISVRIIPCKKERISVAPREIHNGSVTVTPHDESNNNCIFKTNIYIYYKKEHATKHKDYQRPNSGGFHV